MITPQQIRGARAMIGKTQAEIASAAGISTTARNNIERGAADPKASTLAAIQRALEAEGVVFLADGEAKVGGVGVRMRDKQDRPPKQGPIDAPMVRAGRKMKAEYEARQEGEEDAPLAKAQS